MSKDIVPFWEKAYQEYDTAAFSIEPNTTVTEFEQLVLMWDIHLLNIIIR